MYFCYGFITSFFLGPKILNSTNLLERLLYKYIFMIIPTFGHAFLISRNRSLKGLEKFIFLINILL